MTNIEYATLPGKSTTELGGWPVIFAEGSGLMVERVPNLGDKTTFKDTTRWTVVDSDPISVADTCKISGTNSSDKYQSLRFGNEGCIYPLGNVITGFQLANTQDSTEGHALYLRRVGLIFRNKSGNELFWGSEARARSNSTNKDTWVQQISQEDRNLLNGYVVDSLVVEISSKGGNGTNTSQVSIGGFKLYYHVGPTDYEFSSGDIRWVVGTMRKREQAFGEGSIQFET